MPWEERWGGVTWTEWGEAIRELGSPAVPNKWWDAVYLG